MKEGKIKCPVCEIEIESDEVVDLLEEGIDSLENGEVTFSKKKIVVKQRGFGPDSYMPIMIETQICPNCGVLFAPNIKNDLKAGIVDRELVQ